MYQYGVVQSDDDLVQILELQKQNLKSVVSEEEKSREGFLTLSHDFALLKEMNHPYPHIICKAKDRVVGYTLVMLHKIQTQIPELGHMFDQINSLTYSGQLLAQSRYFIMGQVCVAKEARGKGVFSGLYKEMSTRMSHDFDYIITEIDHKNPRSIHAHKKVGFETIHRYQDANGTWWDLILLRCAK